MRARGLTYAVPTGCPAASTTLANSPGAKASSGVRPTSTSLLKIQRCPRRRRRSALAISRSWRRLLRVGECESNDLIGFAVVRPETLAVERKAARVEVDAREILTPDVAVLRVKARQPILVDFFIIGREQVEVSAGIGLSGNLMWRMKIADDAARVVETDNALIVPLANVQPIAVVAQMRAREVRTRNRTRPLEAFPGNECADKAIVLRSLADNHAQEVTDGREP